MRDNDKEVSCLVCGGKMTVSKEAKGGVCSDCVVSGKWREWRLKEREEKEAKKQERIEAGLKVKEVSEVVQKESVVRGESPVSVMKSGRKISRSSLIREGFARSLHDAEILEEARRAFPAIDEKVLKAHIAAEKSDLKKKGLLKENTKVVLSVRSENDSQSPESN